MRNHREPWKWPLSIGLAVGLVLAVALWLPRSWLGFLMVPPGPSASSDQDEYQTWLVLLPPPAIQVITPDELSPPEPDRTRLPDLHQDPRWWRDGWSVAAADDTTLFARTAPALGDTVRLLLDELGLGADFMTQVRPDSLLAARLFLLQLEDSFRYDELKPYLSSMARAKDYADILSRAADMYDEHLGRQIAVPD